MTTDNQQQPKKIKPLDPQLVNRIAAGEIIQRPFNALKELIENCLDAGSTSINVQIKDGGLKLIHITDNGCGIDKDDLKIVCERFTTSKLKEFEDLKSINTFGFRGEALASISHVSRLTIITRTANSPCAFKASYSDGKLTGDGIKPTAAASKGTQIIVEDLFYNSSIRRNALRSGSEEFAKIYEVVSRYAIHNYHAGFFLKRLSESGSDLKTTGCASATGQGRCLSNESYLLDNIGVVYGNELRKELERVNIDHDENLKFSMFAYLSNSKYTQLKQIIFILFINERLVDCQPIKKTLQALFSLYLPKNTNPFIYMNLSIDPRNLDVNIHPTKHEVRFLYQDEIINRIQTCFERKLLNSNVSRTFYVKNLTIDAYVNKENKKPENSKTDDKEEGGEEEEEEARKESKSKPIVYPYQLTRVDTKERKLDSYFHATTSLDESIRSIKANSNSTNKENIALDSNQVVSMLRNQKQERSFNFVSLRELKSDVEKSFSKFLRTLFADMSFVGCLDRELALVQHQTGLYIMNTRILSEELFYQIALFNFGNFGYFKLDEPASLSECVHMALDDPATEWTPDDGPKEKLARRCAKFLLTKAEMLNDYFSIRITQQSDGQIMLEALPMLVEDYPPSMVDLPLFVVRLATEVEYDEEKTCFEGVCREIARFYSIKNLKYTATEVNDQSGEDKPDQSWLIEHVLYKAFANMLLASSEKEKQIYFKLVDLSKLYKVFERC